MPKIIATAAALLLVALATADKRPVAPTLTMNSCAKGVVTMQEDGTFAILVEGQINLLPLPATVLPISGKEVANCGDGWE